MEKHQYMKAFISAALEYSRHPSEATSTVLQRNLGVIGVTLDLSVFDPGSSIAAEFYVSLHELMNTLGSRATLIWNAVAVLQHACRNSAARHALTHTYKFTPILTRLLEANLTAEKRVRVLKLLQELTYGVKISWQEAHLPYLISTLTQWVTQFTEEDVVALSLGVLVNLCYKNLPAIYTLMRAVDTKTFVRTLMKIQNCNINTRVQCCKLLIILDHINNEISEKDVLDFATVTFSSLVSALKAKDVLLLRHIVDFFNDVRENEHSRAILITYPSYAMDVENILATLESNSDQECVALMMEFVLSLVKLQLPALVPLYPKCIKSAMTWIPVEQVCSKALALIRTVVCDARRTKDSNEILGELDLSVLMLVLGSGDEILGKSGIESQARLTELLQLLQEMVRIPDLRLQVMKTFTEQVMRRVFGPILDQDQEKSACESWPGGFFQDPATTLYVNAMYLTSELAPNDSGWLTLYTELVRRKQIQMIMALGLFTGDSEVKNKVLRLTASTGFPQDCISAVARCMGDLQPLVLVQGGTSSAGIGSCSGPCRPPTVHSHPGEMAPLFSLAQEGRLDIFIGKLQEAFNKNEIQDITTSAVMELYEYKLAAMRHAERATQVSLEAANSHATSMQHRLAQVVAESSRLHQLLFYTQQCLEGAQGEKVALTAQLKEAIAQSSRSHATQVQEIQGLKRIVTDKSTTIEELNRVLAERSSELEARITEVATLGRRLGEAESERAAVESKAKELANKHMELSKIFQKMQETVSKKEQSIEEKNKELAFKQDQIRVLKTDMLQLVQQCRAYEHTITDRDECIERMAGELTELSRMRDRIFELTAKKKEKDESNTG